MNGLFGQSATIVTLVLLIAVFVVSARRLPLAAASLPCMMALTSLIYFYVFPLTWLMTGGMSFFGLGFFDLTYVHLLVFLYCLGAIVPFIVFRRVFFSYRAPQRAESDIPLISVMTIVLWFIALGGMVYLMSRGNFVLLGAREGQTITVSRFAFLYQCFTLLIPLTIVLLVRSRFAPWALIVTLVVAFILLQVGFRFRIMILGVGCFTAFAIMRGFKIREWQVVFGAVGGLALMNFIGAIRRYGRGVDITAVGSSNLTTLLTTFGGELGSVLATARIVNQPLPELNYYEPWLVGFARLVPSFLWEDKPSAKYLNLIAAGMGGGADKAGIATPQQIEMLFQLGWPGVFVLSVIYFAFAMWLLSRINKLPLTPRVTGYALLPIFFGYYMQSRGYFFQVLADGLFMFVPLFLMSVKFNLGSVAMGRPRYSTS